MVFLKGRAFMGKKEKKIPINPLVPEQIQKDLDSNGVCYYKHDNIPDIFIGKNLIHPDVIDKSTHVVTAVSGSEAEGRNYMFIVPVRVDKGKIKYETDLDPIIMVADLETGSPTPSGCVIFHRKFPGRTEETELNIEEKTFDIAVNELRTTVSGTVFKFEDVPERFTHAMHYMAKRYRKNYD